MRPGILQGRKSAGTVFQNFCTTADFSTFGHIYQSKVASCGLGKDILEEKNDKDLPINCIEVTRSSDYRSKLQFCPPELSLHICLAKIPPLCFWISIGWAQAYRRKSFSLSTNTRVMFDSCWTFWSGSLQQYSAHENTFQRSQTTTKTNTTTRGAVKIINFENTVLLPVCFEWI